MAGAETVRRVAGALALCGACALAAAGAAGCGGDDDGEPAATVPAPATTPGTTSAPATTIAPETTATTPTSAPEDEGEITTEEQERRGAPSGSDRRRPEDQGDEEPIRVPATFTVRGRRVTPATVTVPAFLSIELTVASGDGRPHVAVLRAERTYTVRVPARGRRSIDVVGVRQGRYPLSVDGGRARATLVAGGEPGP